MVGAKKGKCGAAENAPGRSVCRAFAVSEFGAPCRFGIVLKAMAGQREVGYE
jgi:hypothetical protein